VWPMLLVSPYCPFLISLMFIRVWRYQRGNQKPYIEEKQTTQWPKEKAQKDKQRSIKLKIEKHEPTKNIAIGTRRAHITSWRDIDNISIAS
jgi:hypothetical protein